MATLLLVSSADVHAQPTGALSPAQRLFNEVNSLLITEYGGLSNVDRAALKKQYQQRLNEACASSPLTCSLEKAYPVLEAEVEGLKDKHSYFERPQEFKEFLAAMSGSERRQFGVKLATLDGQNRVVLEVVPGSVAEQAGLQRGDVLHSIGGEPYTYQAFKAARESGQTILLGFKRLGQSLEVSVAARESSSRDLPRLNFLGDQREIAVLRIPTFLSGGNVGQTVHDLIAKAQEGRVQGLVVDLRGNGGGSLSECDYAVSAFVPTFSRMAHTNDGEFVTKVSQGLRQEDGRIMAGSIQKPQLWNGPLAVLVDENSASCSEFFAYEVQYARRGTVIGQKTMGLGNTASSPFQVGTDLGQPSALNLTTIHFTKPGGKPYPEAVRPDLEQTWGEEGLRRLTLGQDTLLEQGVLTLRQALVNGLKGAARGAGR